MPLPSEGPCRANGCAVACNRSGDRPAPFLVASLRLPEHIRVAQATLAVALCGIIAPRSLYSSGRLFRVNVMSFANFLKRFQMFTTGDGEPMVVAAIALLLFMVAVYLLFKRESVWHTISGIVIALVAVFYLLVAGEILHIGGFSAADILRRALRFFGLG